MTVVLHLAETSTSAIRIRTERRSAGTLVGPFTVTKGTLQQNGVPHEDSGEIIAEALQKAGARKSAVTLLLPARVVRCRTVSVDVPVNGTVRQTHMEAAFRAIQQETETGGVAVLYRQPSRYSLDRRYIHEHPVGEKARMLGVHVTVLSIPVKQLALYEKALASAGVELEDVVTTQASLGAAAFPEDEGTTLFVGHGEMVLCAVRDQRLISAGTIPIGARHLIGDIIRVCDLSPVDARAMVSRLLREEPGNGDTAGKVIDARLMEMAERTAEICHRVGIRQDVFVSGALQRSVRASSIWHDTVAQARFDDGYGPLDESGLLVGATRVLTGNWGLHERPQWTPPQAQQPGSEVVRWLKAHF